jgi:TetR/AcrR family transcriptional regulator, mexJK operon transcriptional repressor
MPRTDGGLILFPTPRASNPPRPGRPKDPAKHAAIVEAARRLFSMQPYETVTMEAVAAQAGVSKMTVYSHFRDKEALFERIVVATCDEMLATLHARRPDEPLRARLIAVGTALLTVVLREACTTEHAFPLTMHANRTLAERVYAAGPGRLRAALAAEIASAAVNGELEVDDANRAAEDLISLWEGGLPAKVVFGLAEPASADEIAIRAERGTDVFLRAYVPRDIPPGDV